MPLYHSCPTALAPNFIENENHTIPRLILFLGGLSKVVNVLLSRSNRAMKIVDRDTLEYTVLDTPAERAIHSLPLISQEGGW